MKTPRKSTVLTVVLFTLTAMFTLPLLTGQVGKEKANTVLTYYDGSSNPEYLCIAAGYQPTYKYQIALGNLTNLIDATNTGTVTAANHGLAVGNLVTITGATTDTDLNASYYVQTVADANTFTITTASVTDATYTDAAMVISTNAPRNTASIWNIIKFTYSGSSVATTQSSRPNSICANRAVTTGATKTWYE